MGRYKSVQELKDVEFPRCFDQCAIAQFSDNAYACCEVHCLHKIINHSLEAISGERELYETIRKALETRQ